MNKLQLKQFVTELIKYLNSKIDYGSPTALKDVANAISLTKDGKLKVEWVTLDGYGFDFEDIGPHINKFLKSKGLKSIRDAGDEEIFENLNKKAPNNAGNSIKKSDIRKIIREEIQFVREVKNIDDLDDLIRKAVDAYDLDFDTASEFFYKLNTRILGKGLLALIKFDLRKLK